MNTNDATLFCGRDVEIKTRKAGIPSERIWPMAPGNRWQFRDMQIMNPGETIEYTKALGVKK